MGCEGKGKGRATPEEEEEDEPDPYYAAAAAAISFARKAQSRSPTTNGQRPTPKIRISDYDEPGAEEGRASGDSVGSEKVSDFSAILFQQLRSTFAYGNLFLVNVAPGLYTSFEILEAQEDEDDPSQEDGLLGRRGRRKDGTIQFGRRMGKLVIMAVLLLSLLLGLSSLLLLRPIVRYRSASSFDVDWSRFAYVQYVTDQVYLCNSLMIFDSLHRLESQAERVMMYPSSMSLEHAMPKMDNRFLANNELLRKARDEYGVQLVPVELQIFGHGTWGDSYTKLLAFNQTRYSRVLSLDSDSTLLQPLDELFLLPSVPVALPRAYWLDTPTLSSHIMLITPSFTEFSRIQSAFKTVNKDSGFDMEIVNTLYNQSCLVLPHRKYALLTGEFRARNKTRAHQAYLGNDYEEWDPEKVIEETKFIHFSDYPFPKPWIEAQDWVREKFRPECESTQGAKEDCRDREIWEELYRDFKRRRLEVCGIGSAKAKRAKSEDFG